MVYRYETASVEGFVRQVVNLVNRRSGYYFYVLGSVPIDKDPVHIDAKLIQKYRLERSPSGRYRDKQAGLARVQYVRFDRDFALLSTAGRHPVFAEEPLRDCRRSPIRVFGYRIRQVNGRVEVSIDAAHFKALKASMVEYVSPLGVEQASRFFERFPYAPYYRVKRQQFEIWRAVNRERGKLGLEPVSHLALRLQQRSESVFSV